MIAVNMTSYPAVRKTAHHAPVLAELEFAMQHLGRLPAYAGISEKSLFLFIPHPTPALHRNGHSPDIVALASSSKAGCGATRA